MDDRILMSATVGLSSRLTLISKAWLPLSVTFNPHRPDLLPLFKSDPSCFLWTPARELFIALTACCVLCQENRSIFDAHGPTCLSTFLLYCPSLQDPAHSTPHTNTTLSSHLICNTTLYWLPVRIHTLSRLMNTQPHKGELFWRLYVCVYCVAAGESTRTLTDTDS